MVKRIDVVTLFPEWMQGLANLGLTGRALADGRVDYQCWNPRDYASGVHRSVDDRPYGGGPGMVMRPDPLANLLLDLKQQTGPAVISYLGPQGRRLDHAGVAELAQRERLVLVCGRYEGVDQRLLDSHIDEEWSIGDYVLSGGEPAAAVLIDSVLRLQPGVLGHEQSAVEDSFVSGLLDCPHYTRPETWQGQTVPAVLLSGDHAKIRQWRLAQALHRTRRLRPDLLAGRELDREQRRALEAWPEEQPEPASSTN